MTRTVTERDFRKPEFADADPNDYEFRADGAVVRKDRWETGIRRIHSVLGMNVRSEFEISDIVSVVESLVAAQPDLATKLITTIPDRSDHNPKA